MEWAVSRDTMERHRFKIVSLAITAAYWLVESVLHRLFFGETSFEIIPSEPNELWMRAIIASTVVAFGGYVDMHVRSLREKEREKEEVYHGMLKSANHIINNFLNQMQVVKMEAERSEDFDQEILEIYDAILEEAAGLVKKLETVPRLSEECIVETVMPK